MRDAIHREVCEKGWNPGRGAFTQYYGSDLLDASLLSEEYDPDARRLVGNFPQAFSHVAVLNTIRNLAPERGPAEERGTRAGLATSRP